MLPGVLSAMLALPAYVIARTQTRVVLSNDDGWATGNIRAFYTALRAEDCNVVLSAPAINKSGTSSLDLPPIDVIEGCEFDSCPPGSPPTGFNSSDSRLNYVNSFPATATRYGVTEFGPQFFDGAMPDIVLTGPNVGSNTGLLSSQFSGTIGAAMEAVNGHGIPAVAISGAFSTQTSYTTLDTPSDSTTAAELYAALSTDLLAALLSSSSDPILPPSTFLNVNYPDPSTKKAGACDTSDAFHFVLSRAIDAIPLLTPADVESCGSTRLPTEASVVALDGCFASVSVLSATTKLDADASAQGAVLERLAGFLSCP